MRIIKFTTYIYITVFHTLITNKNSEKFAKSYTPTSILNILIEENYLVKNSTTKVTLRNKPGRLILATAVVFAVSFQDVPFSDPKKTVILINQLPIPEKLQEGHTHSSVISTESDFNLIST